MIKVQEDRFERSQLTRLVVDRAPTCQDPKRGNGLRAALALRSAIASSGQAAARPQAAKVPRHRATASSAGQPQPQSASHGRSTYRGG